ncbi:hypothetical protein G195_005874 [Phytophthora kernoviae 00238/432]|uniref:Uncharacterized protein n=1 Tax=Phytophthora kernoviae 00238/432 TaxID=1284355 RepID=A0A8J4SFA5_9STRA|nr:hypothetical protein G195_005874 [Phytophthora kernoviae 00238/432]
MALELAPNDREVELAYINALDAGKRQPQAKWQAIRYQTDIKEAAFFGKNDAYIIAGSDDGRALVWDKATGELVNAIDADADIVNCVQPHPFDACIATSGIENVIRLWSPTSGNENTPTKAELEDILTRNQSQMDDVAESFGGAMHNMIRLVFQAGGENQAIQECATS